MVIAYTPRGERHADMFVGRAWSGKVPEALDAMVIPAKRALRLRHVGPYEELPAVHQRMHNWMWQQGMRDVGLNWEFYTHWSEDPAERVTDVYYALPKRQAPRSA